MLKQTMTDLFNEKLAGEMFEYQEIVSFFDLVIDEINADLSTKFPALSEFTPVSYPGYKMKEYTTVNEEGKLVVDTAKQTAVYQNYDLFPDKYIRSVVIPGAAYKWFSVDEEGASTAPLFQVEYEKARFEMVRDYIDKVPYEYVNNTSGAITDPFYYDKLTSRSDIFGVF